MAEDDILPILLLFSHHLELAFKSLLSKTGKKITKTHNLWSLYMDVKKVYPDFNLSKSSEEFVRNEELIDREGRSLDYQALKYPINTKGKRFWLTDYNGGCLNLGAIVIATGEVISEVDKYFKEKIFKLYIK